jgi:hypothetical protein
MYSAGAWIGLSCLHDRITQMSSMQAPTCGNSSLTGSPLRPYCLNEYGEPNSPVCGARATFGIPRAMPSGTAFPSSLVRSGFGSNVSTWDGPPPMNRRMSDFAGPLSDRGSRGVPSA